MKGPRMIVLHRCRRSETILAHAGRVRLAPVDSNHENLDFHFVDLLDNLLASPNAFILVPM